MLLTGRGACSEMLNHAKDAWRWALASYHRLQGEQRPMLPDVRGRDVHLHLPHGRADTHPDSCMAVMGVALLSLLTGRKPRRDVAVSGYVSLHDILRYDPPTVRTPDDVARLEHQV